MVRKYNGKDLARVLTYYGYDVPTECSVTKIVCPFHEDLNPSMAVDFNKGMFSCYGCGATGNAYKFVRLANPELNELQCCVLLEKIINSDKVKDIQFRFKKKKRSSNKQALNKAHDYFYGLLQTDWNNPKDEDEQKVLQYMQERGFNAKALNVVDCRANYNIAYPLLFPILDNGEFKGWVGRTTNSVVQKKRKYLYNEGFRKRDTLCGNYRENKIVFICEGFMDYLSLRTRGHIKDVVAILGWHISDEQVEKLKQKGITTVVSALDNDDCGKKGPEYLKRFFKVVRFDYPDNVKDAGDMTEKQLKRAIRRTKEKYKHDN